MRSVPGVPGQATRRTFHRATRYSPSVKCLELTAGRANMRALKISSLPLQVLTSNAYVLPMIALLTTLISSSAPYKVDWLRRDGEPRLTVKVLKHGNGVYDVTPHYFPRRFSAPALEKHKVRDGRRSLRNWRRMVNDWPGCDSGIACANPKWTCRVLYRDDKLSVSGCRTATCPD
ncbi:hypothetical protein F5887DRAFT_423046 [Amanita rubescens]|nr:hypothetical protein F5887DRAFT_423046 [Amanita rubescens]